MYDLLLTGGHVVDPSQELDGPADVAFQDGRVAAVGPGLDRSQARDVRDVSGKMVVPGLIDLHTHVYWGGTAIGVDPDDYAKQSGITTLVDAGTAGPANIMGFRRHVIEPAAVRVLPYINISFPGIFAFSVPVMVGENTDLRLVNARECLNVARENMDLIVGVKVRVGFGASGTSGVTPLDLAIETAEELGLPVMAHLDFPPPTRRDVLTRLRRGDVLTHCFRPFPSSPARGDGAVREEVLEARERGIIFDIGHGGGSFCFKTAKAMLAAGFLPDCVSSDVHTISIKGPMFDLLVTMSKLLCLGMPLNDLVRATTETPALAVRREDLGTLKVGAAGDATILRIEDGQFEYIDVLGATMTGDKAVRSDGIVLHGAWWHGEG